MLKHLLSSYIIGCNFTLDTQGLHPHDKLGEKVAQSRLLPSNKYRLNNGNGRFSDLHT